MKRVVASVLTAIALAIGLPAAQSATPVIRVTDIPHRNFDGTFRDNELVNLLGPSGRLGKALFNPAQSATWVIDPYLVDEVLDMADGYTFDGQEDPVGTSIAQIWLQQLRIATLTNPVVALPYGNPDTSLARRISSRESKFYFELGAQKLEAFLGRPVISQNGWGVGKSRLNSDELSIYREGRKLLAGLNRVVNDEEIDRMRERLATLLNPQLKAIDRNYFASNARIELAKIEEKLKVVTGRYQLTSKNVKVPLTLVNKFETATSLSLSLIPMNSRVQVESLHNIELPAKSQIQIAVPFTVIASGNTVVHAQFMTPQGDFVGEVFKLNLTLTVIDSRVTWFTTGAAILLFLGAVTQSVRRVRRSRHEK